MKINAAMVLGACVSAAIASTAQADFVLANWTFETAPPADLSNSMSSPIVNADAGIFMGVTSQGSGFHASAATDWTTPVGNGSLESLSSNTWAIGDYYQFSTSSTAYSDISISWDQTGSATGPRDFILQYSTDGVSYTTFTSYQITSPAVSWSSAVPVLNTSYSFNLSAITALNNDSSIFFRFVMDTTTAINGTTVAAGGTGRVDNIVISAVVPAPGAIALLGLAGLVGGRRRRR